MKNYKPDEEENPPEWTFLSLRVEKQFSADVKAGAEDRGLTKSAYIRAVLEKELTGATLPKRRKTTKGQQGAILAVNRIGTNLNQLTKAVNEAILTDASLEPHLAEVQKIYGEVSSVLAELVQSFESVRR